MVNNEKCKCGVEWSSMLYGKTCGRCGEQRPDRKPLSAVCMFDHDSQVMDGLGQMHQYANQRHKKSILALEMDKNDFSESRIDYLLGSARKLYSQMGVPENLLQSIANTRPNTFAEMWKPTFIPYPPECSVRMAAMLKIAEPEPFDPAPVQSEIYMNQKAVDINGEKPMKYHDIENNKRRSGRTARMLLAAINAAFTGRAVYILTVRPAIPYLRDLAVKICQANNLDLPDSIKFETPDSLGRENINWHDKKLNHAHPNCQLFIDHVVYSKLWGHILEGYHEYDGEPLQSLSELKIHHVRVVPKAVPVDMEVEFWNQKAWNNEN